MADYKGPTIRLHDGVDMPQLGLGVWQTPSEETAEVVRTAIDMGYGAVDTASIYGNEEGVGAAVADRPDIFVTTKLWNADQGYDAALRAFDASIARLGRDTVNLYLIHWPSPHRDLYVPSWKALIRLKQEGRVRSIGVSNFGVDHLQRIIDETGEVPTVNQIELHPRFQQRELRAFHAAHGIATESWSPLGKGTLFDDPVLGAIATRHGKTSAQIVLRWHIDSGLIVIPKSTRVERLHENSDLFDFALDAGEMAQIASLDSIDGRGGPDPLSAVF
jgi:2,5-diketo-D-gluconate reductase A